MKQHEGRENNSIPWIPMTLSKNLLQKLQMYLRTSRPMAWTDNESCLMVLAFLANFAFNWTRFFNSSEKQSVRPCDQIAKAQEENTNLLDIAILLLEKLFNLQLFNCQCLLSSREKRKHECKYKINKKT